MAVNEIVVISGKGGTGKTTLTASIIPFLEKAVLADCDVDAPDLHILLHPEKTSSEEFIGTQKAFVDPEKCINCKKCYNHCKFNAISESIIFNTKRCEGCGVCKLVCPTDGILLKDTVIGTIFFGNTAFAPMVHARLIPGEETSGKLVSRVRNEAKRIAEENNLHTVLIDGSPGIGCNVISSITGAAKVVIVTEPTFSGLHDLQRVFDITEKFSGQVFVVINKYDLSLDMSKKIEIESEKRGAPVVLKLAFNKKMVKAITNKEIPSLAEKEYFKKAGWDNFIQMIQ
ncbi:MAG: ATP-binding protein [Spirochaetaceae bacterium]|jgi:MinD superfamily P-loop ATPase|nr:ATP-binding protein [Spirochaetaceae bacterium]